MMEEEVTLVCSKSLMNRRMTSLGVVDDSGGGMIFRDSGGSSAGACVFASIGGFFLEMLFVFFIVTVTSIRAYTFRWYTFFATNIYL